MLVVCWRTWTYAMALSEMSEAQMCIQIYFILCHHKNIDNPPATGHIR